MKIIDLRSDTVTRPTPAMREAMARAEVGDDVYGEDPTVNRLQARVAELLGKEAGLFVPSGTMANQVSLGVLTRPGDEIICDAGAHCISFETGALAADEELEDLADQSRNGGGECQEDCAARMLAIVEEECNGAGDPGGEEPHHPEEAAPVLVVDLVVAERGPGPVIEQDGADKQEGARDERPPWDLALNGISGHRRSCCRIHARRRQAARSSRSPSR